MMNAVMIFIIANAVGKQYRKEMTSATEYNIEAIKSGRYRVQQGDVSALALPEEKYDLATAFETIYF